jgi:hypothetical protein
VLVVALEWAREPGDRVRDRIRRRLGVRGSKGGRTAWPEFKNSGSGGVEQKQRRRGKVEDDWTNLKFSKVPGICL